MEELFKKHRILISQVGMDIVCELTEKIAWEKPLVAIRGSRGVGKTTMMRQYIRNRYGVQPGEALYCVMDSMYLTNHSQLDMAGLSFREFLRFYHKISLPAHTLEEILSNPDAICDEVNAICHPQKMFEEYLRVGFYPFYDGDEMEYYSRIENVVQFIIDQEMTLFCGVVPAFTRKLKAMLLFLAANIPYEVNIAKLASYIELNKTTVLSYLSSMNRAELLHLIYSDNKSVTKMQKPDKIYIHNPNMLCTLASNVNIGTLRECFFVNQLAVSHTVEYGKTQGDFLIDGRWRIEVGGKDKTFDQIADLPDSYIFADMMEYPIGKKLPLWMAGLTY